MATARKKKDTSDSIKDCSICNEEYDEDQRCPRNLQCSHCLCTECITSLINRNEKQCPFCRRGFQAQSAKDLEKNAFSLELLKCVKDLQAENESLLQAIPRSRSEMVEVMKANSKAMNNQNLAAFRMAEQSIKMKIKTNGELKNTVMESQKKFKGEMMNRINEMEERCQIEVAYLEKETRRLQKQFWKIQEKVRELEEVDRELKGATTLVKADSAIDKVEASNAAVKTWIQDFKLGLSRGERILEGLQKSVKATEAKITEIMTLLTLTERENLEFNKQLAAMRLQENIQGKITAQKLKNMDPQIKYFIKLGGIYVVHHHEGKSRTGQISLSEGKLLLHCLKDQELPSNVCSVEHRELMDLVDPESRHAYLEFGKDRSILGRVLIEFSQYSLRGQTFALLCSGERGISYEGTNILQVNKENRGESITCGISKLDRELIPGSDMEQYCDEKITSYYMKRATLCGNSDSENLSHFDIIIQDIMLNQMEFIIEPRRSNIITFAKVEAGLDVLTDAISNIRNIRHVKIVNCGLVLPL